MLPLLALLGLFPGILRRKERGRVQRNTKRGSQMRPHTHSENWISIWRFFRVEVNSEAEKLHWWVAFGPQWNCLQVLHKWILAIYQHFFTPCFLLPHNPSLFIGGRWNTRSVSKKRWEQAIDKNSYFMHFKFIGLVLFYQTKHFTCILFFAISIWCGRQDNGSLKDIHALSPETCEYVASNGEIMWMWLRISINKMWFLPSRSSLSDSKGLKLWHKEMRLN